MILPPPGASFFRVQRNMPVAAGFLARILTAKDYWSDTDKEASANSGGPSGRRSELDSFAFRSLSKEMLKSLADLFNGIFPQATSELAMIKENGPVIATNQRELECNGESEPSVSLSTTAAASTK